MAQAAVAEEIRPVRVILREFVKQVIEGEDEINTAELLDYAIKRFEGDEEFRVAALRDLLSVLVPDVLAQVVREAKGELVRNATGYVTNRKVEETTREKLGKVFESSGHGYKSFLALRKHDLVALNERDAKEVATRQRWIDFRIDLAGRMNDTQPIGDAFTGNELEATWKKHFETETPE